MRWFLRIGISLLLAVLFITGATGLIYFISLAIKAVGQYKVIASVVTTVVLIGALAYSMFYEEIEYWIECIEDWVAERKTNKQKVK